MSSNFFEFLHVHKNKTFRPKKKFPAGTMRYNLHKHANASLHAGVDIKQSVKLPPNETLEDWLAVHAVDFFNRINLLYGIVADNCNPETCPTMSGGTKYEYLWQDGRDYKKPTKLPACEYVSLLMDWIESKINDGNSFPTDPNVPFPKTFLPLCKKIMTRLFRVFVHVYIHHFDTLVHLGAEPHVNTCYKHFYYFITEFGLVDQRELQPLKDMTDKLMLQPNGPLPSNQEMARQLGSDSRYKQR